MPKFVNGKEVGSEDNPDELIIQDFDINGIPVDICVYRRPNKNTISGITLNPNLDKSPLSVLDTTYGVFKRLLMSKYGAPNEERTPEETGGMRTKALWSFPSTSIQMTLVEGGHGSGYLLVNYKAVINNPM